MMVYYCILLYSLYRFLYEYNQNYNSLGFARIFIALLHNAISC